MRLPSTLGDRTSCGSPSPELASQKLLVFEKTPRTDYQNLGTWFPRMFQQ